jgi:aspartate-semialdehyde dehydrogenase
MQELLDATRAHLAGEPQVPRVLPHPYAFNLFSHDTPIDPETGGNGEETKVVNESQKILADPDIRIGVTCVRVPVLRAHAIAMTLECERPMHPDEARALLADAPGLRIVDDRGTNHFPMPSEASGQGRRSGRPHPLRPQRSVRPVIATVRPRRPAAEGRRAQRGADRRAPSSLIAFIGNS